MGEFAYLDIRLTCDCSTFLSHDRQDSRLKKKKVGFREGNGNQIQQSCLGNSMDKRSLGGSSPWARKELDMTEEAAGAFQRPQSF